MVLSSISKIMLVLDFVTTQLDQCNGLCYGLPEIEVKKLQRVLNAAARVVARPKKRRPRQ